jgi:hypothetical protein
MMAQPRAVRLFFWILLLLGMFATIAAAQDPGASNRPSTPQAFGPEAHIANFPSASFHPRSPTTTWVFDSGYYLFSTTADPCFLTPVELPSGAKITAMSIQACDTSLNDEATAILLVCPLAGGGGCATPGTVSSFGSSGCSNFGSSPMDIQISNVQSTYMLQVCSESQSNATKFREVTIFYKLQLGPAPAAATFGDVQPSHPFFRAIEALAAAGITSGCGSNNYCPEQNLTRGELAKFLSVALGLGWGP